jgi:hypothetical protein
MSTPPDTGATEIFAPPKLFDRSSLRPAATRALDLTDSDQVFDLALAVARGSDRRVLQASLAEQRAIAALAVQSSVIASQFLNLIALSDANAPPEKLLAAFADAATVARAVACPVRRLGENT